MSRIRSPPELFIFYSFLSFFVISLDHSSVVQCIHYVHSTVYSVHYTLFTEFTVYNVNSTVYAIPSHKVTPRMYLYSIITRPNTPHISSPLPTYRPNHHQPWVSRESITPDVVDFGEICIHLVFHRRSSTARTVYAHYTPYDAQRITVKRTTGTRLITVGRTSC